MKAVMVTDGVPVPMAHTGTGEHVAALVHDLASPTAAIVTIAEAMLSGIGGALNDQQRDHVARIHRIASYLIDLGRDVLTAARLEAGQEHVRSTRVDIAQTLGKAVEIAAPRAEAKGIELRVGELPRRVAARGDPIALLRVVNNLVSNAIKFSPPSAHVDVGVRVEGDDVVITVADNGPGIPADETPRLFQKFSTTSVQATRGERGSGLGLYIARRLTELQHGSIRVRTARGWGTSFEVQLPMEPSLPA